MRKFIIGILSIFASLCLYAREVYCVIQKEGEVMKIISNKDYLNDFYWDYITKDSLGNEITFSKFDDAINHLANFGWNVVKSEQTDSNTIIMSHEVDSYMDIKSSRDKMIQQLERSFHN